MMRGTIARIGELTNSAIRTSVPTRELTLHVLPTKHCHVCSAAGDRGNYAARKAIVESVIGQIKQARGFRQFLPRGFDKVQRDCVH